VTVEAVVMSLLSTFAGIVVGAVITFLVSRYYFRRASIQLEEEASRLRQLVTVVALYMQRDGQLENVELDERGNLKGYTQTIYVPGIPSEESFGEMTVTQGPPPIEDPQESEEERPE
jgi:hypothetical protein